MFAIECSKAETTKAETGNRMAGLCRSWFEPRGKPHGRADEDIAQDAEEQAWSKGRLAFQWPASWRPRPRLHCHRRADPRGKPAEDPIRTDGNLRAPSGIKAPASTASVRRVYPRGTHRWDYIGRRRLPPYLWPRSASFIRSRGASRLAILVSISSSIGPSVIKRPDSATPSSWISHHSRDRFARQAPWGRAPPAS